MRLDWSEADEAYIASSPEFPGLTGVNEDSNEALAELREAIEMAVEILEEDGEPLPTPRILQEYSGQFRLRVPKALHATLARQADEEGVSLNSYVSMLLAFAAGQTQAQAQVANQCRDVLRDFRAELAVYPRLLADRSATNSTVAQPELGAGITFVNALQN
jgi:predicted HicB family RNase H-like nuclease